MSLETYPLHSELLIDRTHVSAPSTLRTWQQSSLQLEAPGSHFGYVYQGCPRLTCGSHKHEYCLQPGMFFVVPGSGVIQGGGSAGIVISHSSSRLFTMGGPIALSGNLAYIDGGTTSLLIPPMILGDPCLNALYFPPGVDQTLHSHPSDRLGMVISGQGEFETPESLTEAKPGEVFLIPENALHKFRTTTEPLTLVIFHPDSDVGFDHTSHPMLNRTLIDGVSATQLPELHTPF